MGYLVLEMSSMTKLEEIKKKKGSWLECMLCGLAQGGGGIQKTRQILTRNVS